MEIVYTKMQGAGNDFIVIDNRRYNFSSKQLAKLAAQVCQRKFSIGADALMAVDHPEGTGDFRMRFIMRMVRKRKCVAMVHAVSLAMLMKIRLLQKQW